MKCLASILICLSLLAGCRSSKIKCRATFIPRCKVCHTKRQRTTDNREILIQCKSVAKIPLNNFKSAFLVNNEVLRFYGRLLEVCG